MALQKYKKEPPALIEPKEASAKLVGDSFTCNMCLCVLLFPLSCGECEILSCSACLEKVKMNGAVILCPNCRKPHSKSKINRILRDQLEQCEFSCTKCRADVKYS